MEAGQSLRRVLIAERLTHLTDTDFDEVLGNLRSIMPRITLPEMIELSRQASDEAEFARMLESRFIGGSGFYRYAELNYACWIHRFGVDRRAIRFVLGNPMITATLMRQDIASALFSPMEILLVEAENRQGCSIMHMRPSTLIALEPEANLLRAAAEGLDDKMVKLIRAAARRGASR